MEVNHMNLRLKGKIVEKFGSQSDFAARLGLHDSVVSQIVRRRRTLPVTKQQDWARLLECRVLGKCCVLHKKGGSDVNSCLFIRRYDR